MQGAHPGSFPSGRSGKASRLGEDSLFTGWPERAEIQLGPPKIVQTDLPVLPSPLQRLPCLPTTSAFPSFPLLLCLSPHCCFPSSFFISPILSSSFPCFSLLTLKTVNSQHRDDRPVLVTGASAPSLPPQAQARRGCKGLCQSTCVLRSPVNSFSEGPCLSGDALAVNALISI